MNFWNTYVKVTNCRHSFTISVYITYIIQPFQSYHFPTTTIVCVLNTWEIFCVHGHLHHSTLFPPLHPSRMYHLACCAVAIFVLQHSERKLFESLLPCYLSEQSYNWFYCAWFFVLIGGMWCSSLNNCCCMSLNGALIWSVHGMQYHNKAQKHFYILKGTLLYNS